ASRAYNSAQGRRAEVEHGSRAQSVAQRTGGIAGGAVAGLAGRRLSVHTQPREPAERGPGVPSRACARAVGRSHVGWLSRRAARHALQEPAGKTGNYPGRSVGQRVSPRAAGAWRLAQSGHCAGLHAAALGRSREAVSARSVRTSSRLLASRSCWGAISARAMTTRLRRLPSSTKRSLATSLVEPTRWGGPSAWASIRTWASSKSSGW